MFFGGAGGVGGGAVSGSAAQGGSGGGIVYILCKTLSITGFIKAHGSDGQVGGDNHGGGGGGAGGSVLLKVQTATLGTTLVLARGGGGGGVTGNEGGAGSDGRVHIDYATSFTGTTNPTLNSLLDDSLSDTPAGSNFTLVAGGSNGKIYSWDGASTFTELFDTRRLQWFDTVASGDTDYVIGDDGGTERAQAQSFKLAVATKVKAVEVYIQKADGTPSHLQLII